jgi:hypothetical protein
VQNRRSADDGVAGKRQFFEEVEYPGTDRIGLRPPLQKDRFEMAQFLRNAQHLLCRQAVDIDERRQAVATVGMRSEDVDVSILQMHSQVPYSSPRSCCANCRIACSSRR